MIGMRKRGCALALAVLMSGCAATDEPYVPSHTPTSIEPAGDPSATRGPVNSELFSAIEKAENFFGGHAVAVESRAEAYTVSVISRGTLREITIVGSGVIVNTLRDFDEGLEDFLENQVVTLADAVDAASIATPGRVDSARIVLDDGDPHYVVVIETDEDLVEVKVDGYSAQIL